VILNPEANFTAKAGQSVTLVCVVSGSSPYINWYRDGKVRSPTHTSVTGNSVTTADLTIDNVQAEDSGGYTCTVSNYMGSINTQMYLVVQGKDTLRNRVYHCVLLIFFLFYFI
jgi:aromatic ring hydroxylase